MARINALAAAVATSLLLACAPAFAQGAKAPAAGDVERQWADFLKNGTAEQANAAYDAMEAVGYALTEVDAGKCRSASAQLRKSLAEVPVSLALQRAALLCAEATGDAAGAEAAAARFGALAKYALSQADRGAWARPVRVVMRADGYALMAAAGLEYAYEMYTQQYATPYFPLMIAARLPDSQVLRHVSIDFIDTLQAVDRADATHGTPRLAMTYVNSFLESGVKADDLTAVDLDTAKKALSEDDMAARLALLRGAAQKGGLNSAATWLALCANAKTPGCADGLVDALLPLAEQRHAYPMMLLALAYREGVGIARDDKAAAAMLDAADRVWEHNGATVEFVESWRLLHPDESLPADLRERLVRATAAGNRAAAMVALRADIDGRKEGAGVSAAEEALLAHPDHNGLGNGLLVLAGAFAESDKARSEGYLQRAADAGNPAALRIQALRMREAEGGEEPTPKTRDVLVRAAMSGDADAANYLAYHAIMAGDRRRAEDWVLVPAVRSNANSMFLLASLWSDPGEGLSGDPKAAVEIYQGLAEDDEQGPRARRALSMMAISGTGMKKDLRQARAWLEGDAAKGDVEAQVMLGSGLLRGTFGAAKRDEGAKWLDKAIAAGSTDAMDEYGLWLHDYGKTDAERTRGIALLRQAAKDQPGGASNNLAWLLCVSQHAGLRAPAEGVELAKALEKQPDLGPATVDTLAACYAAAGEHAKAAELQTRVVAQVAKMDPKSESLPEMRERLALYQQGKAYVQDGPGD